MNIINGIEKKFMIRSKINSSAIRAGFLLSLFLFYSWLLLRFIGTDHLTPAAISAFINDLGWLGPILYVGFYSIRPFLLFPAIILTLAGGLAFGPIWGTVYVVFGASAGAGLCFYVARRFGQNKLRGLLSRYTYLRLLDGQFSQYGFRTVLVMRLVLPYDPVSYAAGLSGITFREYILATILGTAPGAFAYIFLGHSLHQLFTPTFYIAVALVLVLWFTPVVYRMVKRR
jgi:uncharacterized membrane protein YdjX (TVP38/TMEM64 family)